MRIQGLWRHPVKSLQGQPVARASAGGYGLVGDRGWAVRDVASGGVLSAKREPRLLLAAAAVAGEGVTVTVPGADGPAVGRAADVLLSAWLGREVTVDVAAGAAYVDEADLHLVGTGELGSWDVRRFRPNVVVETPGSLDDLVGERLRLGDAVVVEVVKRTKRCAMPTMRQPGIDKDVDVLRALARGRDLRLGVYARVVSPGRLDVGALISLA